MPEGGSFLPPAAVSLYKGWQFKFYCTPHPSPFPQGARVELFSAQYQYSFPLKGQEEKYNARRTKKFLQIKFFCFIYTDAVRMRA